jgi:hypothetical protein
MSDLAERARRMLARPGAWIDQQDGRYPVRVGGDRRSRISLTLDEADFRALIADPGLRTRPGGGWTTRPAQDAAGPAPGRPGQLPGELRVIGDDGRLTDLARVIWARARSPGWPGAATRPAARG